MIKPMRRASIAAAKWYIQAAQGIYLDGKEVVIPAQTEDGPKLRVSITQFCRDYAEKIEAFNARRLQRRKVYLKMLAEAKRTKQAENVR